MRKSFSREGFGWVVLPWLFLSGGLSIYGQNVSAEKWESTIQAFEKLDRKAMPEPEGVLFLGSSSIRMWETDRHFEGHLVINRGFGGSQISDSIHFADRIVIPYRPREIFFYAGDNDISAGKTPKKVFQDFKEFVRIVRTHLSEVGVHFIAIKPSLSRWNLVGPMREANSLIREYVQDKPRLSFVDIDSPMIGKDGRPRPELFIADGLHLSEEGYRLWSKQIWKAIDWAPFRRSDK